MSLIVSGCATFNFPRAEFVSNIPFSSTRMTITNASSYVIRISGPGWSIDKNVLQPGESTKISFWNGSGYRVWRSVVVYRLDIDGNITDALKRDICIPPGRYPGDWIEWPITEQSFEYEGYYHNYYHYW